ncbi:hypothetical protein QBC39DRAFT_339632 [Podospora conica]|nr:hypothetical protein QBC39DRAFT_339632 [Schizothecium conicum]
MVKEIFFWFLFASASRRSVLAKVYPRHSLEPGKPRFVLFLWFAQVRVFLQSRVALGLLVSPRQPGGFRAQARENVF